ncbi:MAG: ABC transporter ATP-binding protein [Christensenellaceae bacterium]|nr:ABC transporter ATP-binding protein [Christensenellaceae bacterium]
MNAIEVKNVTKAYPKFTVDRVSLTLPAGCIMGLVGENGAGKTTLIRLIMGAARPDSGSVTVLNVDNRDVAFHDLKEHIGVVLDEAFFPEVLTPRDIGRVMAATYRQWDDAAYQRWLTAFSLPEKQRFHEFSRGMKMKLSIAVALSHAPRLLVLDEPTGGLDPVVRDEILTVFNDFAREDDHAVLISSHIVSDLEKICDYIACLHRGKLLLCEEKDRLLEEYAIVKLSQEEFAALPQTAIHGRRETPYCVEALVERSMLPASIRTEHASLEDILLFLVKEGK